MTVTNIEIIPVRPKDGLVAFANCTIDNQLSIASIAIYTRMKGGYRLVFPGKKLGDTQVNYVVPTSRESYTAIENAIVNKYEKLLEEANE